MNDWRQRRVELVDLFVKRMEVEYDIKEMTTDRQKKNGTRQFVLPNGDQLASYKTGYVRRCNSSDRLYQLNKVYKREERWTVMSGKGELRTIKSMCHARELIHDPLARLIYIIEFCKRNHGMRNLTLYNI
tara:strand:+ start:188 stop:577 length:390 start_codon:yes stop_codon:yes gene_type:complete